MAESMSPGAKIITRRGDRGEEKTMDWTSDVLVAAYIEGMEKVTYRPWGLYRSGRCRCTQETGVTEVK